MHCNEFHAALHAWFTGELPAAERARVDAHVEACPECAALMAVCREISCRELVAFLDDYVDERLEPERRAVFERHLALCSDCRSYLESYRLTRDLGGFALREVRHGEIPEELVRAILAARQRE